MASYLACLNFIILPVHKSYRPTVNEHTSTNPFDVSWTTVFTHSFIRNWNCPLVMEYGQAAVAGLVHFYTGLLYAVMPKIITHNRFTALLEYVRDHPGEQVLER